MDHPLFSDTVLQANGTITCTHPETQCRLTFRDPNNVKGSPNALDIKKKYPFPQFTHYIRTCECPIALRQFWCVEYRDHIVHVLEDNYSELDVLAGINESDVTTFWYGDKITEASKADTWVRVARWEYTLRMLATCKLAMGLGTIPRDTILTAKAFVRNETVMWTFEDLPRDFEIDRCDDRPVSAIGTPGPKPKHCNT